MVKVVGGCEDGGGGISGMPAIIATRLAPESVHAFLPNDRNHHQPRNRIGPPPAQQRIQEQAAQENRRQVRAEIGLPESAFMAPLPIPAATRRFARANNGMTTTETAATMMPGMLRSGASCRISVGPDS